MVLKRNISRQLAKKISQRDTLGGILKKCLASGAFYRFGKNKRNQLLIKYHRLTKRVNQLGWEMKLAAVGGAVTALANSNDAIAQGGVGPFVQQSRAHNPLRPPLIHQYTKPTSVDLDNDGDFDIVVGSNYGYIQIFVNEGTPESPGFTEVLALNQTSTPISQYGGAPAFADLNDDGDLDMVFGLHAYSVDRIQFWVGNGGVPGDPDNPLLFTEQIGPWDPVLKTGNPFYGILPGAKPSLSFVDLDGDGDLDALIGHDYDDTGDGVQVHYYENDGNSNFSKQTFGAAVVGYISYKASPQIADIDEDGNPDLVVGRRYGDLLFFKGDGVGNFNPQTGPWDPTLKTGNPFFGIDKGVQTAPTFVDLDNDGDLDLVLGFQDASKYNIPTALRSALAYFENTGNAVFEEKVFMENPFDGIDVGVIGIPNFVDVDGDGDLDAVLGGKYDFNNETPNDATITVLENTGGSFGQPFDNKFSAIKDLDLDLELSPIFVNLDADADLEIVAGTANRGIQFFDLVGDEFAEVTGASSPFYNLLATYFDDNIRLTMGDIDGDGDLDLFVGGRLYYPYFGKIRYFENTGTAIAAEFTERTGSDNLLSTVTNDYPSTPLLVDIDNDGDLDAIVTEAGYISDGGNDVQFFENTGTATNPILTKRTSHPILDVKFKESYRGTSLGFIDLDNDGDNDFFSGSYGKFTYYLNDNPSPATTLNGTTLQYAFGTGPIVVDATLTLADTDGDDIVKATVAIQNYQPGNEILGFTDQVPITGNFDSVTGVLTLEGRATVSEYQAVLRTITYSYTGPDPGARKRGRTKAISRTIAFQTFDADLTAPTTATRTISIASSVANQAPVASTITLTTVVQGSTSIDLFPLISDTDGNFDPNATGAISIQSQPQSGASATLNGTVLTIDYTGLPFTGNDTMQIQICDVLAACTDVVVNVAVTSSSSGEIIVRNGMSPNGDGLNDYFRIENIATIAPENKVSIFNRWGDKVFEIDNYNNLDRRFEGKSDSGKELSSGVYFYKIELGNGQEDLKGYLTLKR